MAGTKKKAVMGIVALLSLASCDIINPYASSLISSQGSQTNASSSGNRTSPYYMGGDYFRSMVSATGRFAAPSTGNVKAVVIPVVFAEDKDAYSSSTSAGQKILSDINKTFFGTAAQTDYWESLSSYYQKSSYGNLNITGTVTDFYYTDKTSSQYTSGILANTSSAADVTNEIMEGAYDRFFTDGSYDYNDYDSDGDEVIDLMWMVYCKSPNSKDSTSLLWAYTYWDDSQSYAHIYNYSWASYSFMHEGTSAGVDAHTFIHETGHQMGLDDYYSYDDNPRYPLGGTDMMDYNIVDHNSFSKYCLDWITPTVGTAGGQYILRPFESSGDALILASGFNGTCFDEYLIMEYYTPTGLNELDSEIDYSNYPFHGLTASGLRIMHVDQRLGKIVYSSLSKSWSWDGNFYDDVQPDYSSTQYYEIVSSNSKKYCLSSTDYALISLVQASGKTNLMSDSNLAYHYAQNSDLFTPTSLVFGQTVDKDFVFDNGLSLPAYVSIGSMDDTGITLSLVAK